MQPDLISEATSDQLFRQIADAWLGPVDDDPMDDYDRYASGEEMKEALNRAYMDRLDGA